MSDWAARNSYLGSNHNETCNFCGCIFNVEVRLQDGHNEMEEYYCPDCHKEFKSRACNTPIVSKISDRTDGKTENYKNS